MDSFLFEEKFKEKHFYATILNSIYEHKQKDSLSLVWLCCKSMNIDWSYPMYNLFGVCCIAWENEVYELIFKLVTQSCHCNQGNMLFEDCYGKYITLGE